MAKIRRPTNGERVNLVFQKFKKQKKKKKQKKRIYDTSFPATLLEVD